MLKQMRRYVSGVLLFVALMIGSLSISATETETSEYVAGDAITAQVSSDGTLEFTGTGDMYNWSSSSVPWKNERAGITKVVIGDGVTSIGNNAFYGCSALNTAVFPKDVTKIGENAFYNCTELESVEFPTSLTSIGYRAFSGCTKLNSIPLNEGLTSLGQYAFQNCTALTEVKVPSTLTSVESRVFSGCSNITKVTFAYGMQKIPNNMCYEMTGLKTVEYEGRGEEPSQITEVGDYAFYNCTELESVEFPASLTSIGYRAFSGCTKLNSAPLKEGLTSLGQYAFQNCTALTEVKVPSTLTSVESRVFSGCSNITKVTFAYGMQKIPNNMCYEMTGLKTVEYEGKGEEPSQITEVGNYAFYGCSALNTVVFPKDVTKIGENAFYNCTELESVEFPTSLTFIEYRAFSGCAKLNSVPINEGLTSLGQYAFQNCTALTEVKVPSTLTSVGSRVFSGCSNITKVTFAYGMQKIPNNMCYEMTGLKTVEYEGRGEESSQITEIGNYAFYGCTSLKSAPLSDKMTELGDYAFANCSELETVILPKAITKIGANVFNFCTALTHVELNEGLTTVGNYIFNGCTQITEIRIPSTLTNVGSYGVFYNCTGLRKVIIGYGMEQIPAYLFAKMTYLEKVEFEYDEDGKSTVTTIGRNAFSQCPAIEVIELPESVTTIERNAFYVSNQQELLIGSANEVVKEYDWEADSRTPYFSQQTYKAGDNINAILFDGGILLFTGSGKMYDWTADTLPWKDKQKEITNINITRGVTSIGNYAFAGSSIKDIALNYDVTSIGEHAFAQCDGLTYIEIAAPIESVAKNAFLAGEQTETILSTENEVVKAYDWTNSNRILSEDVEVYAINKYIRAFLKDEVLTISGRGSIADYGASSMPWKKAAFKEVQITEGIRRIGDYNFYEFADLRSIKLPSTLESIGEYAFCACTGLEEIEFPESLTTIENDAFRGCTSLLDAKLPKNLATMGNRAFWRCTALSSVDLNGTKLTEVPDEAFRECSSLRIVQIPAQITRIDYKAFANCPKINTLTLAEGVNYIGGEAFSGCDGITKVKIPRSLTSVGYSGNFGPFGNGLKTVTFGTRTRSVVQNLFKGCTGLTEVTLPETVSEIEASAFKGCTSLQKIQLSESVFAIGAEAFSGCTQLKDINFVDGMWSIGNSAFYDCTSLEKAVLPKELKTIGNSAFSGCSNLAEVEMGENLTQIPFNCFQQTALQSVNIPYKVTRIYSSAFADVTNLKLITIPSNVKTIDSNAISGATELVIVGSPGSVAEEYAKANGYTFDATGIAIEELKISKENIDLMLRENEILELEITPFNATEQITWGSADESIATVSVDGANAARAVIYGNAAGTTEVYAEVGNKKVICNVTVRNGITDITLNKSYLKMTKFRESVQLTASIYPWNVEDKELLWKSSDKNVATVDNTGLVTAVGNGMARITVSSKDESVKTYCFVNVNAHIPVESVEITRDEVFITNGSRQLGAKVLPLNASNQKVTWFSEDETVATVDENGVVTAVAEGTTRVIATTEDGQKTDTCTVTVQLVDVQVTGVALDKERLYFTEIDATEKLTVAVQPENASIQDVLWFSENEVVAVVDKNGVVTAKGGGVTKINALTKDGDYIASCEVTVHSLVTGISLSQQTLQLEKGATAALTAAILPQNALNATLEWYSTNTRIVTVSNTGEATAVGNGTAYVKCRSLDGSNITASCKVTVAPKVVVTPPKNETPNQTVQKPEAPTVEKTKITSLKAGKKQLTVKWKKIKGTGYQIQYSTKKNFSKKSVITIKKASAVKRKITKLKSGKKYYVRVRAYKTVKGKEYYGEWSTVKSKKVR